MKRQIIVGMSGHIDHGKTSIVKSLTGKNTDSLDQEQSRGMTIDIGFAHLSDKITIIDVPGHEKFIKNMVTGVNYIDFAILVVAADDGVMPQTREHFEILKILNIQSGCIVINKIDLVEEDWLSLVESDIEDLVRGSFLEKQKVFRVSTLKNLGISELKSNILDINLKKNNDILSNRGVFRMYVDRSFSQQGFGTIVTGTAISGEIAIGDSVKVLPVNQELRLRSAQSHYSSVDMLIMGDRAALNLHGVDKNQVQRGAHISNKDIFACVDKFIAKVSILNKYRIKQNQRLRFHIGPNEVIGRISIFDDNIEQKSSEICLIKLEKPVVISFQDRFLIRSYSPMQTIGGGIVCDIKCIGKWKQIKEYAVNFTNHKNIKDRILFIIENQKGEPLTVDAAECRFGMSFESIMNYISVSQDYEIIDYLSERWIVTKKQLECFLEKIINNIKKFHLDNPYSTGIIKKSLFQKNLSSENFFDFCIDKLVKSSKLNQNKELISLNGFKVNLSDSEQKTMNLIIDSLNSQEFNSQNYTQLSNLLSIDVDKIKLFVSIAEKNGKIIRLNEDLLFTSENFDKLVENVKIFFASNDKMTVSQFKDIAKTTRKYAMPILEYFDKTKITYREDNYRKLV
mgnify:FL=1